MKISKISKFISKISKFIREPNNIDYQKIGEKREKNQIRISKLIFRGGKPATDKNGIFIMRHHWRDTRQGGAFGKSKYEQRHCNSFGFSKRY